ncbi:cupin domain-containing protein [Saccharothrix hoggarensis]|uniref:Cupin domain-containing protein n=1 Tax=Saccharothrix hoggarensis TaxID=913853 RepID=A0ABW3QU97_9PSEU
MEVVKKDSLPTVQIDGEVAAHIFDGSAHGTTSSAFIVDVAVGKGPRRHSHPYDEIFIIIEGRVSVEADGEVREAGPEDVLIVRTGVPHAFTNLGPGNARMVNIHVTDKVVTEFPADHAADSSYQYNHTS